MAKLSFKNTLILAVVILVIVFGYVVFIAGNQDSPVVHSVSAQQQTPVTAYLILDGVKDTIALKSYDWTASSKASTQGARYTTPGSFHLVFLASKTSVDILRKMSDGRVTKSAVISLKNGAGKEFARWTLYDVYINSYKTAQQSGAEPLDEIEMSFGKYSIEYANANGDKSSFEFKPTATK